MSTGKYFVCLQVDKNRKKRKKKEMENKQYEDNWRDIFDSLPSSRDWMDKIPTSVQDEKANERLIMEALLRNRVGRRESKFDKVSRDPAIHGKYPQIVSDPRSFSFYRGGVSQLNTKACKPARDRDLTQAEAQECIQDILRLNAENNRISRKYMIENLAYLEPHPWDAKDRIAQDIYKKKKRQYEKLGDDISQWSGYPYFLAKKLSQLPVKTQQDILDKIAGHLEEEMPDTASYNDFEHARQLFNKSSQYQNKDRQFRSPSSGGHFFTDTS